MAVSRCILYGSSTSHFDKREVIPAMSTYTHTTHKVSTLVVFGLRTFVKVIQSISSRFPDRGCKKSNKVEEKQTVQTN